MKHHLMHPFSVDDLPTVLEKIPVGVTVTDLEGRILYFNEGSSRLVDRKPEYLGRDIRDCHKLASSRRRIDEIIAGFKAGKHDPVVYTASHYAAPLHVAVVPLEIDGELAGLIHCVVKSG
ncbi:MAG: PAS domain-containing protein [Deltaproteobacteria bacterium]|nr:PAS domain-containing protein [Deltaproteobacteria bacterium]